MNAIRSSVLCVGLVLLTARINAADIVLPIEAPVVLLPGTPATTSIPVMSAATRPVPAPTTPSGRLPQYQLGPSQLAKIPQRDPNDAGVRFRLTMPNGPLLVEVAVTIDGKPYLSQRDRRIAQLLEQQATPKDNSSELVSRLQRYREATGRTLTSEEINWWFTTAVEGPSVLCLKDGFQRFRADQRPVFFVLDRNQDGTIDSDELGRAEESLLTTDANRNDIVEFTELGTATRGKRNPDSSITLPQISSVEPDRDSTPAVPDLLLAVDFRPSQPSESRLQCVQMSATLTARVERVQSDPAGISLRIDNTPVLFEAVQVAGLVSDQISVGSVNDGYPWLPVLDLNDDGRLTVRERRQLPKQFASFDANHDGTLTADEAVAPFRIAIGLGATVHRHLANIRSVHPRSATPAEVGPEWFMRMDRNKDRDLTRAEFPGTNEQFRAMDRDDDKLIDIAEAMAYDQSQPQPTETDATTVPQP